MRFNLKRVWSGVAALAVAASTAPLFGATAAHAAGVLQGAATVRTPGGGAALNSGTSANTFTLRLPAGAACPGDSANSTPAHLWHTYMVPASVDPSTLTFDANGPTPFGTGATFRQPLYDTGSSPIVNQLTAPASPAPGPGPIVNIPDASYAVFAPGDIPAGVYNIGIACTSGPEGPSQMSNFWNVQKTFTTNAAGGPAQVNWQVGTVPNAPALTAVSPGDTTLQATFTPGAAITGNQATSGYTATATPSSGPAVTATGAGSPLTITGLTNGTAYSVTVLATNPVGNSAPSNAISGTPAVLPRPPVTNLQATPGTGQVSLTWTAPTGAVPTGYQVAYSPGGGTPASPFTVAGTSATITGLTAGTQYTFTVTPQHATAPAAQSASAGPVTPLSAQSLVQEITVVRPAGAVVLTQICGKNGAIPADTAGTIGFPNGTLPAIAAAGPGTMPSGETNPIFLQYPYPTNADGTPSPTYPTQCGVNLGNAQFIRTGPGAGQFYAASGVLNQVTVVDTRDTDNGWNAVGTMSRFVNTANATKSFSGSQLGWNPLKTSDTAAFSDSDGNSYDQTVVAGAVVNPNTPNASGLGTGRTLGSAAALAGTAPTFTGGLGISELDARLKLLIPVTAVSGTYTGTLTFSVI